MTHSHHPSTSPPLHLSPSSSFLWNMRALWLHLFQKPGPFPVLEKRGARCLRDASLSGAKLPENAPARGDVLWLKQTGCVPLKMDQIESRRPGFLWRDLSGSGFVSPTRPPSIFTHFYFPFLCFCFLPPAFYLKTANTVRDSEDTTQFFPPSCVESLCLLFFRASGC